MGRTSASVNYAIKSLVGNTFNIYLHGTFFVSLFTLLGGLLTAGNLGDAIRVVVDLYIANLLYWPLNEAYLAGSAEGFVLSHIVTVGIGLISATSSYWGSNANFG